MEGVKKRSTYSIDEQVRKDFKAECVINDVDMSEVIENFMANWVLASRKMRAERESKNG